MSCKPDQIKGRVLLTTGRPKPLESTKINMPKIKCSLETTLPLHTNLNCRPKALLKFEPISIQKYHTQERRCATQRQREGEERALLAKKRKKKMTTPLRATDSCDDGVHPALDGRLHQKVQTEVYLEELKVYREKKHSICQTDLFLDRPPTPYFIPGKIGLDKETQIYGGELFDFDIEVTPVLEVLVGKVVEQSLLEVQEEEELASLRQQQRVFEEMRDAEFEEQQRLEEQERRIKEEKMERLKQEISRQRQAKLLEKKISAVAYSRGYIGSLVSATFGELISGNYFYDDKEKVIETVFHVEVLEKMTLHAKQENLARRLLDLLIREVCHKRFKLYKNVSLRHEVDQVNPFRMPVRAESYDPLELPSYLNVYPKSFEELNMVIERIKNIFFLKDMPQSHLINIANGLSEKMVSANETVYRTGDVGDVFYIVKSGVIEKMDTTPYVIEDYFGEMALLYNQTRKATVRAKTDGLLWFMKRSFFKQIINRSRHDSHNRRIKLIRKVKLFKYMTDAEVEKTADTMKTINFRHGDIIFEQGEKANSLVILDSGSVKLITTSEAHPDGQVSYMEVESYFGELALISEIYRSSTVYAIGDVTVLVLDKDAFDRMVGNAQEIFARKKLPETTDKSSNDE